MPATAYHASIGPALTLYDIDGAALTKRNTGDAAGQYQYAWRHPSRRALYVASQHDRARMTEMHTMVSAEAATR